MITVACFFWVDPSRQRSYQISPDDVRIWNRMVERNLTVPHRRVCVTHRPDLIDFMETIPLDMEKHHPGTCLVKLQAHKTGGIAAEGERVLLMDVDCVVTGNLDPLVERGEPSVWWMNPNYEEGGKRGYIQGSLQLFSVGATEFLWRDFDKSCLGWLNRRFGGAEQCWISERMNAFYPEPGWDWSQVATWTDYDGVYGAGRLVNGTMGNGVQSELPDNARIVFTPGDRSPSQPEFQAQHPWVRNHFK